MVTRIEIGNYVEEPLESGKKRFVVCEDSFETFAELGDADGEYLTSQGAMGVSFRVNGLGHRLVTFDVRNVKGLQSPSKRRERTVNVSNQGVGTTILRRGKILRVTTNSKFE